MVVRAVPVLSVCSGVGGLELGMRLACPQARVVCYVEREAFAASTLVGRMEEGHLDEAPVWTDLASFDAQPWRGHVEAVVGGYPCQSFSSYSTAVDGRHPDDHGDAWPHALRVIREAGPRWCFFENVANHLKLGFPKVRADLEAAGFRVEHGIFSARQIGAPHLRKRIFILAHTGRKGLEGLARPDLEGRQDHGGPARPGGLHVVPPFPPGKGTSEGWPPSLEPVILGVDDGVAHRVDRIRACGEGVVPVVAALAFITLVRRAIDGGR